MKRTYDSFSHHGSRPERPQYAKRRRDTTWRPAGEKVNPRDLKAQADQQDRPAKRRSGKKNQAKHKEGTHLSNKIHSLRRLLDKATDMPADLRQEKERELAGYMHDQGMRKEKKDKSGMVGRYHFVRFLERKKAERRLKSAKTAHYISLTASSSENLPQVVPPLRNRQEGEVSEDSDDEGGVELPQSRTADAANLSADKNQPLTQSKYERKLHEAEVDLNYTLYAPLDEKYISLFALVNPSKVEPIRILRNQSGEKPPRWYDVEEAMVKGTLEALRDGKWARETTTTEQEMAVRVVSEETRTVKTHVEADDSDGDFFDR